MKRFYLSVVFLVWSQISIGACAPGKMIKVVFRNATPNVVGTFSSKPVTLYRYGSYYTRVEEMPNDETGIHGLIVKNQRNTWMIDLNKKEGKHIFDSQDDYSFHAPIIGWEKSPLARLEFGCEVQFMKSHNVKPVVTNLEHGKFHLYSISAKNLLLRLWVNIEDGAPQAVGLIKDGDPIYLLRYDEYRLGLDAELSLFNEPLGISYAE